MNLLLIGPPGSGKGTQGELLSKRFGLAHIAAGDYLRAEVEAKSEIGLAISDYLDRGELVPDEIVIELLTPKILTASDAAGYVLDGFPRSVGQAMVIRDMAEQFDATADAVIYLEASRDELVRRILARAKTEDRSDDTEAVIHNRLQIFDEATHPLVEYYRERGVLHVVDANQSEERVTDDIIGALGSLATGSDTGTGTGADSGADSGAQD